MKVSELMKTDIEEVAPKVALNVAAEKMRLRDIGCLPVTNKKRLVGILTDRDIVIKCVAENRLPEEMTAGDVMTDSPKYCYSDDDARDAKRIMINHYIRRLPVLNKKEELVGIVTVGDIARMAREEAAEILDKITVSNFHSKEEKNGSQKEESKNN